MRNHLKRKIVVCKIINVSLVIALILLTSTIIHQFFPCYGNDKNSINKIIAKKYDVIDIVDVIDYHNYRFAGFLSSNGKLGFAEFQKNKHNNYEWRYTAVQPASNGICSFFETLPGDIKNDGSMQGVTITVSNNQNLAKVKRIINQQYTDEKETNGTCPTMVLLGVDIPENYFQPAYYYYDTNGNIIN